MSNPIPPAPDGGKEGTTTQGEYANEPTRNLVVRALDVAEDREEDARIDSRRSDPVGRLNAYESARDAIAIREVCRRLQEAESRLASPVSSSSSVPAPTQREEWVVQYLETNGEWEDDGMSFIQDTEADGRAELRRMEQGYEDTQFRLVRRRIEETVIEEPS